MKIVLAYMMYFVYVCVLNSFLATVLKCYL